MPHPDRPAGSTRERSLVAAVELVGEQGIRALTHARIDESAALPKGSTSNWFRTREALLSGVITWIAESERADLGGEISAAPGTPDELVDALCTMVEVQTGHSATRSRARYALFLEASADHDLLAPLLRQRVAFEEWVRSLLAGIGADDPDDATPVLMAGLEGLVLHRLTVDPQTDVRPAIARLVRGCLPPR